jgi:uncharacterized RmlC-like cupin family protein
MPATEASKPEREVQVLGTTSYEQAAHLVNPAELETINVLGPTIQYLTEPGELSAPCIMRGTIPAGVSVPLHSHADPETFLMLSDSVDGLINTNGEFEWVRIDPGGIFHVPSDAKHAWRNQGQAPAAMIIVSTSRLGRFLREIGKPHVPGAPPVRPSESEIQHFLDVAARYGYWNATREENARIGIRV